MLKRILQSLIGAAVIVASLPLQIVAADNDTPTEFDYSTATVNLNIRVLDEGKRYVDKLDISTASTSENCGLTIQNAWSQDGKVVYTAKVDVSKLKYGCFFPMKLRVVDTNDDTFPSGIVSLPDIDERQFSRIISQAIDYAQRESQKWGSDPVAQQKFPNGYSAFKVTVNVNVDIRADYQMKNLTAFCQTQRVSIGTAFKDREALVWTEVNDSYNEIRVDFSGIWAADRITATHVKTGKPPSTTPIFSSGSQTQSGGGINVTQDGSGAVQDLFAQKYWQSALSKYAGDTNDFNPYSNKDKLAFYGRIVSGSHKQMLDNYTIYLEDSAGKMVQRAVSNADGVYFFFPDGIEKGKKYNIVVPNSNYNTRFVFPYNGITYPFFRNYGQSVVYEGSPKQVDVFLEPNIIKETSQAVVEQSFMTPGAWATLAFFFIFVAFLLYKLGKIKSRERKKWQVKL